MCVVLIVLLAINTYLIQNAIAQDKKESEEDVNLLGAVAIPLAVAAIGAIAASWNFIQAKWNGHYFQNLILAELGELQPNRKSEDALLKSHMKKSFMHRDILENKEFIFTVDTRLVYLTRQVWSAFDNNDVAQFLVNLHHLTTETRRRLHKFSVPYDEEGKIYQALNEWVKTLKNPEFKYDVERGSLLAFFKLDKNAVAYDIKEGTIDPKFLSPKPESLQQGVLSTLHDIGGIKMCWGYRSGIPNWA